MHLASLGEFEGIALQAQEHLHDPLLVSVDHEVVSGLQELVLYVMILAITFDILKGGMQSDFVVLCLSLLNDHDLFDSIDYVEIHDILAEFAWFYLSVVQEVLNYKREHIGRGLLDLPTWIEFAHYSLMLF